MLEPSYFMFYAGINSELGSLLSKSNDPKVTSYILLVTFRKSNSLHITYYFQEKVTRYYYILLYERVTSNILLVTFFTKVQYCSKNLVYTNPAIFKSA